MSNIYTAGLINVGSYQVSGIPYATGSLDATNGMEIVFPYVTQWITFINHDSGASNHLYVGFSENGVANSANYFRVGPEQGSEGSQNITINVKVSRVFISGSSDCDVIAGLTNLPTDRVDNIAPSGSNWSGSVGVG